MGRTDGQEEPAQLESKRGRPMEDIASALRCLILHAGLLLYVKPLPTETLLLGIHLSGESIYGTNTA